MPFCTLCRTHIKSNALLWPLSSRERELVLTENLTHTSQAEGAPWADGAPGAQGAAGVEGVVGAESVADGVAGAEDVVGLTA